MKNKESMQKIYKRRKIAFVTILAIVLLCLIISLLNKNKLSKIAQEGSMLKLGAQEVDISNITSNEPNVPVVGAGMIPIKWNSSINMWQITTKSDKEWYNYEEGNYANVMLSDGYYKSELQVGTTKEQLSENNVGVGIPNDPEHMGTIYTWIPRFAYLEDDVKFLKNNSILEYEWTTESCFNLEGYGANSLDLAFTGIWVGEKEYETSEELEARNSEMLLEDNIEGLISNEKIFNITESEKTAIQKLTGKYANTNTKILQDIDGMQYRQVIKIVNTNSRIPIVGKHTLGENEIKVDAKYAENTISFIADKNGNTLSGGIAPISEDETQYTFYIVDSIGNIRKYRMSYGSGKPNIKSFNKNTTFYVTYDDETGEEISNIPIGEKEPENWYNYEEQKWANIVVREEGKENYFVWIPRFMYKIGNAEEQRIDAKLVDLENVWTDPKTGKTQDLDRTDYKLPEAFTWEDPEDPNNKIQLSGYWLGKYKLRDDTIYTLDATVTAGETSIKISNIVSKIDGVASYDISLIQDGKIIKTETMEGTEHLFTELNEGETYSINIIAKDEDEKMLAGYSTQVTLAKIDVDLTGFNKATTYYVTYDENGIEHSEIPIGENPPDGWYNYAEQKWANIVVRDQGEENYYVWIPRYQYLLNSKEEKVKAELIPVTKETPDPGYKIPEAFTWTITKEDDQAENGQAEETIQLPGYWLSKYKLRDKGTAPEISGKGRAIYIKNINEHVKNLKLDSTNYTYEIYLISEEGKRLVKSGDSYVEGTSPAVVTEESNYTFTNVPEGKYSVNIMLKDKTTNNYYMGIANYVTVTELKKPNAPDLTGFNPNLTFYVTYNDVTGAETSNTPINDTAPDGWYDYDTQKWANVVVRDNGSENYFVWIPRYEYAIDAEHESTDVVFIPASQLEPDDGYKIPEAFTWQDPDNPNDETKKIQLSGYWLGKYKLRDDKAYTIDATVAAGANKIRVSDIVTSDTEGIFFTAILIQDGKKITEKSIVTTSGDAVFGGLEPGKYSVLVEQWNGIQGTISAVAEEVVVQELDPPDLTGFNVEKTYIVTYDDSGNETSTQTLKSVLPGDAVIKNDALVSGKVDESRITGVWYDYAEQKWANIVVKDNIDGVETENYFVWIPRYEYITKSTNERVKAILITTDKIEPDEGYKIPEAFTWEDPNNPEGKIQLPGYWLGKYKLRQ